MARSLTTFKPGNKAAVGHAPAQRFQALTQSLISQLREVDKTTNKEKIHLLVAALIKQALGFTIVRYERDNDGERIKLTEEIPPDLAAIKYIWDRLEGTPMQSMAIDAPSGRVTIIFEPLEEKL